MPIPEAITWLDRLHSISNLSFERTGTMLLATLRPANTAKGEATASRIWRFGTDGSAHQLSHGPNSDGAAKASPADERIAFTSDRLTRGKMGLFLLDGLGDARPVGDVPGSIEDFVWTRDGADIVVLSADKGLNGGATNGATRLWWGDAQDPEQDVPGSALRRLFKIHLADGRTEEVGPEGLTVWEFDLVPGGAVAVASPDASERGWHHPTLIRIDFSTRAASVVHETEWQLQGLTADAEGKRVAFLEGWSSDRGLVAGEMRILDLDTRIAVSLAPELQSNVTALYWRDADTLWFTGWQNLGSVYGLVSTDGRILGQTAEEATIGEDPFVARMAVSPDGKALAAIRETIGTPQEIFYKPAEMADWRKLGDVNGAVAKGFPNYPEIRHITWTGTDGLPLESFVFLPPNLGPGPHAMVVEVHGGPCMSTKFGFNPGGGLGFAGAGYIVFVPNYRGNVGWGQAFTRMNLGDPAGMEFSDIMAGVDKCIELGLADADRIGITGASYGGYLTNWAVAATDRFKAAIPVSSISNQLSCHYSCEHDFHEFINGGTLEDERYRKIALERSPLARLDRPTTPTLLIQGRDDRCTPLGQAQEYFAALQKRGVTTELVVYPREGHGLREREHRHDAWRRRVEWFDRFLRPGSNG